MLIEVSADILIPSQSWEVTWQNILAGKCTHQLLYPALATDYYYKERGLYIIINGHHRLIERYLIGLPLYIRIRENEWEYPYDFRTLSEFVDIDNSAALIPILRQHHHEDLQLYEDTPHIPYI